MTDNKDFLLIRDSYEEVVSKFNSLDDSISWLHIDLIMNTFESLDKYQIKHKIHLLKSQLYSLESKLSEMEEILNARRKV